MRLAHLSYREVLGQFDGYEEYLEEIENINEKKVWEKVLKINTKQAYLKYIEDYPTSKYAEIAEIKAREFIEIDKKDKENKDWEEIKNKNTTIGYKEYIKKYPKGTFVNTALDLINIISLKDFNGKLIENSFFNSTPPKDIGEIVCFKSQYNKSFIQRLKSLAKELYEEFIEDNILFIIFGILLYASIVFNPFGVEGIIVTVIQYGIQFILLLVLVFFIVGCIIYLVMYDDYYVGTKGYAIVRNIDLKFKIDETTIDKAFFSDIESIKDESSKLEYHRKNDKYNYVDRKYKDLVFHRQVKKYFEIFKKFEVL